MAQFAEARVPVGPVMLDATTFDRAVDSVLAATGVPVRLVNAWSVVVAHEQPKVRAAMSEPGLSYPDGAPVVAAMRRRGASDAERVRGPSLFRAALDRGRSVGASHFFAGATSATLVAMTQAIAAEFPGVRVAGTWAPPFEPISESLIGDIAERVNATDATVVWVGLGTPKQDLVTPALAAQTGRTCVGVGAAFDFVAGTVREAPRWMQRAGLEWLFRLLAEPKRLWRRYLIGNARFLWITRRA